MDTAVFRQGKPVYIDYPFENVMFRYEQNDKTYRKFYGENKETEIPFTNDLFRQAMLSGTQISKEGYDAA